MNYQIKTYITAKKRSAIGKVLKPLLFIILIPVLAIAFLSSLLVSLLAYVRELLFKNSPVIESYHEELILIEHQDIKVFMIEDEADEELSMANEAWAEKVFGQHTYLYRVKTIPLIPELHGSICGFYLLEKNEGAILQQLLSANTLETGLLFLNYETADTTMIGNIGAFYLYNDEKTGEIKGFNEKQEVLIELIPR
ncbi:MAG: hypothetical protein ABI174_04590 [Chitinophagaceae bacterium]